MSTRRFRVTVDGEVFEVEVEELAGSAVDPAGVTAVTGTPVPVVVPPVTAAVPPSGPARPVPVSPVPERLPAPGARPDMPAVGGAARPSRPVREEAAPGGGERVEAPLPGTVVSVNVKAGQEVKARDVLVILEAMKMQNEIVSPRDGRVRQVAVAKGDTVALGDLLVIID